jgi:hypothetical protein
MGSSSEIPSEWVNTLLRLQEHFPEAVIAGGAIRDTYLDRPVKDIDIFVANRPGVDMKELLDKAIGTTGEVLAEQLVDYENGTTGVSAVYDYKTPSDFLNLEVRQSHPDYQVIVIDFPKDLNKFASFLMEDFDIGLCRVMHNGREPIVTPEFNHDRVNKTLTVFTKADAPTRSKERTTQRIERISEKYRDHKVVYPSGYWPERLIGDPDVDAAVSF